MKKATALGLAPDQRRVAQRDRRTPIFRRPAGLWHALAPPRTRATRTGLSLKKQRSRRKTSAARRPTGPRPRRVLRLAGHIRPQTIELHFDLDPVREDFRGDARYRIRLDRSCRQIELHAMELELSGIRLHMKGESLTGRVEAHPECETIILRFGRLIPAGEIELELRFCGRVRDDLRGLYRSTDRERPWLASQLCPTDARRLFP
ncbi:MAG: hypothetical protein CL933_14125, partial [Deltaproteobacteria bacterium]|nr:hypothetical protein [Deltaproteobacteria bacterium]